MGGYIKRTCLGKHTQTWAPTKELLKQQFMVTMVPNGQNQQETAQLELKHKNSFNTWHLMELPKSPMEDKVSSLLNADGQVFYGKQGAGGITAAKSGKALVVGYDQNLQPGQRNNAVENLAQYLTDNGY